MSNCILTLGAVSALVMAILLKAAGSASAQAHDPVPLALVAFSRELVNDIEIMMARAVLTLVPVPVLFLALQRFYVRVILFGSVTG
jgi:ABC-type glycerol-3-phosphate transport system permease component